MQIKVQATEETPVFRGDANHERGDGLRHRPARKRKGGKANRARLVGVDELDGAPPSSSRGPGSRFIFGGENDAWEMLRSAGLGARDLDDGVGVSNFRKDRFPMGW